MPRLDRLTIPLSVKKPTIWAIWNDLFHQDVPLDFINEVLDVISACPQHTFLALTKRAHLIEKKLYNVTPNCGIRNLGGGDYLSNLWIGVTVCNQQEADEKIPLLLKAWPGKKFLSIEPMLTEININKIDRAERARCREFVISTGLPDRMSTMLEQLDAVILGGETGPKARPMHPDWVRSVRDQCWAAGVPFFFKQWGEWYPCRAAKGKGYWAKSHKKIVWLSKDGTARNGHLFNDEWPMQRIGTKKAGRLLDGREWNERPEAWTC